MILENIKKQCDGNARILYPETDERVREAVKNIKEKGIAAPSTVSNSKEADINPKQDPRLEKFAKDYYELRKHKGTDLEAARKQVLNPVTFSALMIKNGLADGMVVGASLSAAESLVPIFQVLKPSKGKASSHFLMIKGDEAIIFADCAVLEHPTAEELADIAVYAAQAAENYGLKPKIAMLSYKTGSGKLTHVNEATTMLRKKGLIVEGEIQFDAAYVPEIGEKKGDLRIKGDANVFIFPDLASGNIGYKIAERMGGYRALGPVIQGLNHRVAYLSRGCSVQDIVDVTSIISAE